MSELVFQNKTDGEGHVTVHQILGTVIERSEKRHGTIPADHTRECVILPGKSSGILGRI